MDEKNKKLLTRSEDRISFLYIEKANVMQSEYGVQIVQGNQNIEIPITTINCILLGPGTSITHRAIANIAAAGCSICWIGSELTPFYAYGEPSTTSSKNMLAQIKHHESKMLHMKVIHDMYTIRYPDEKLKTKTLAELRGIEGLHVKSLYEALALQYSVAWSGRKYKVEDFNSSDVVNQYLTALNHVLYAVVQAIVTALGFLPGIGFIHTGKTLSFVYDIADLYKEKITIPLAFKLAAQHQVYDRHVMLKAFREDIYAIKLMKSIVKDILSLFHQSTTNNDDISLTLWDYNTLVHAGRNYGNE